MKRREVRQILKSDIGCDYLRIAIIEQAAKDMVRWNRRKRNLEARWFPILEELKANGDEYKAYYFWHREKLSHNKSRFELYNQALREINDAERFLESEWAEWLVDLDMEYIVKKVRERIEAEDKDEVEEI